MYGNIKINYELTDEEVVNYMKKICKRLHLSYQFFSTIIITTVQTSSREIIGTGNYYGLATQTKSFLPDFYSQCHKIACYLDYQLTQDFYKVHFYKDEDQFNIDVIVTNPQLQLKHFQSLIIPYINYVFNNAYYNINLSCKIIKRPLGNTGRKLGIDYYNGLISNNGGSPWGKDPYNSDLALNLYARKLAIDMIKKLHISYIQVKLSYFGQNRGKIELKDENNKLITYKQKLSLNKDLIKILHLNKPIYVDFCKKGLFFSKI
jgi:hypothetical protein